MPISLANERIVLILPRPLAQAIRERQFVIGDRKRPGQFVREQLPKWLRLTEQSERLAAIETKFDRLIDVLDQGFEKFDQLGALVDALRDELQVSRADAIGVDD
jgi:hypothetical protein